MEKQKKYILISLLNSFNSVELKQFTKLINSLYFNTDTYAIKLFEVLNKEVVGKKAYNKSMQLKIFKATFPKEKVKNNQLTKGQEKLFRAKMSVLTKLGKQFLINEALKNNTAIQQGLLNQKLIEKNQFDLFKRVYKSNKKLLEKQKRKGKDYYNLVLELERGQLNYLFHSGLILTEDNLTEVNVLLDFQYLINKLELQGTMQSVQNILPNKVYDSSSVNIIEQLLELPNYKNNALLTLHRANIKLIKEYNEENYQRLIELLNEFSGVIPKKSLIDFYTVASNYCGIQIRKGRIEFYQVLYQLYKVMDQEDLIIDNETIEITKLKNIIIACCHLNDFDWALKMAHKYSSFIKKEVQISVHQYNLGIIEFYKSNYQKAISHFIRVGKVDLIFDIEVRIQILKSYYEMDREYDERTVQVFRSSGRFVQNIKSLASNSKIYYKNFIQILINIYRIKHKIGKRTLESVTNKLNKMNSINDKKWLLEKIASLE